MSDIIEIRPQARTNAPKFKDAWLLKLCGEWRANRAQQQRNWAEHEVATMWGTLPDAHIKLDLEPLGRMHEIEDLLQRMQPDTLLCAREMLGIAVTILAYENEDPDATLAQGPVLDLVRNVSKALERLDGATELRRCQRDAD